MLCSIESWKFASTTENSGLITMSAFHSEPNWTKRNLSYCTIWHMITKIYCSQSSLSSLLFHSVNMWSYEWVKWMLIYRMTEFIYRFIEPRSIEDMQICVCWGLHVEYRYDIDVSLYYSKRSKSRIFRDFVGNMNISMTPNKPSPCT